MSPPNDKPQLRLALAEVVATSVDHVGLPKVLPGDSVKVVRVAAAVVGLDKAKCAQAFDGNMDVVRNTAGGAGTVLRSARKMLPSEREGSMGHLMTRKYGLRAKLGNERIRLVCERC